MRGRLAALIRVVAAFRSALLLVTGSAVLVGCTVLSAPTISESPTWFKTPPNDTSQFWYGTGSGYNRQSAMAQALADVATRLKATVQSQITMQRSKVTSGSSEPITNHRTDILNKLSTGEVAFPGGTTALQSSVDRDRAFILLQVSRSQFVQHYSQECESIAKSLRSSYERAADKAIIEQYFDHNIIEQQAYKLLAWTDLLNGAGGAPGAQTGNYQQLATDVLEHYAVLKDRITFTIVTDRESGGLKAALREALTREALPVVDEHRKDSAQLELMSTNLHQDRDDIGGYEVSFKAQLALKTNAGKVVAARPLSLYGASTIDYQYAMNSLADDLKAQVLSAGGLLAFLGHEQNIDSMVKQ